MITRVVFPILIVGTLGLSLPDRATWAGEARPTAYALPDIVALAVQHNPTLAGR